MCLHQYIIPCVLKALGHSLPYEGLKCVDEWNMWASEIAVSKAVTAPTFHLPIDQKAHLVEEEAYRPFRKCRPLRRPHRLIGLGLGLASSSTKFSRKGITIPTTITEMALRIVAIVVANTLLSTLLTIIARIITVQTIGRWWRRGVLSSQYYGLLYTRACVESLNLQFDTWHDNITSLSNHYLYSFLMPPPQLTLANPKSGFLKLSPHTVDIF